LNNNSIDLSREVRVQRLKDLISSSHKINRRFELSNFSPNSQESDIFKINVAITKNTMEIDGFQPVLGTKMHMLNNRKSN